jgi:hypothetical protein
MTTDNRKRGLDLNRGALYVGWRRKLPKRIDIAAAQQIARSRHFPIIDPMPFDTPVNAVALSA